MFSFSLFLPVVPLIIYTKDKEIKVKGLVWILRGTFPITVVNNVFKKKTA